MTGTIRGLHVTAKTVGVGMPVAGGSAAKRVFQLLPRAVIHLGTCGIYPGFPEFRPHDVLVANDLKLVDAGVRLGKSTFPEPMQTSLTCHGMLAAGLAGTGQRTHRVTVGSPLAQTIDDAFAVDVPRVTGCHAENLEAFAIAHACLLAQIPFTSVLGATHMVGSRARDDWVQFERQSTIAAAEVVATWIVNGAQGLPHG
jgi:nucleoside phosphorylase